MSIWSSITSTVTSILGTKKATTTTTDTNEQHYNERIALFSSQNVNGGTFLIGDSITEIWEMMGYTTKISCSNIINRGIAGDTTLGLVNRMPNILMEHPNKAFILIGTNNLGSGKSDMINRLVYDVDNIIGLLISGGCQVFLEKIMPYNPFITSSPIMSLLQTRNPSHVTVINDAFKNLLASKYNSVTLIDTYTPMLGSDGVWMDSSFTNDGLHPNEKGYGVYASILNHYM